MSCKFPCYFSMLCHAALPCCCAMLLCRAVPCCSVLWRAMSMLCYAMHLMRRLIVVRLIFPLRCLQFLAKFKELLRRAALCHASAVAALHS